MEQTLSRGPDETSPSQRPPGLPGGTSRALQQADQLSRLIDQQLQQGEQLDAQAFLTASRQRGGQ